MWIKTITVEAWMKKQSEGPVSLVDVREPVEYRLGHIEGACLMPLGELDIEAVRAMPEPRVFYCRSGKRSALACAKLKALDASLNVVSLEGGILAWREHVGAGQSSKAAISADRYVHLKAWVILGGLLWALSCFLWGCSVWR